MACLYHPHGLFFRVPLPLFASQNALDIVSVQGTLLKKKKIGDAFAGIKRFKTSHDCVG